MPTLRVYDVNGTLRDHVFEDRVEIGRAREVAVQVRDKLVSRRHARVERQGAEYVLIDLDSTQGTFVAGRRISRHVLRDGEHFAVAHWQLCFLAAPTEPPLVTLQATLAEDGLAQPPIPPALAPALRQFEPWWFGTRKTEALYGGAPLLLAEVGDADVPDYLIIGHAGHGINSYALHYFLRLRPLLLLFELRFGGAYTNPEHARAEIAEAFAAAEALVAAVPALERRGVPPAGLCLMLSSVRPSLWRAGTARGDGRWNEVLAAACAWATSDEPFAPTARRPEQAGQ